jgi:hypothetical protein
MFAFRPSLHFSLSWMCRQLQLASTSKSFFTETKKVEFFSEHSFGHRVVESLRQALKCLICIHLFLLYIYSFFYFLLTLFLFVFYSSFCLSVCLSLSLSLSLFFLHFCISLSLYISLYLINYLSLSIYISLSLTLCLYFSLNFKFSFSSNIYYFYLCLFLYISLRFSFQQFFLFLLHLHSRRLHVCVTSDFFRTPSFVLRREQSFLDSSPIQGCQMVFFQTKTRNLGKIWMVLQWKMSVYFMDIWSI